MEEKLEFKVIEIKRVAKAVEGGKRIKVRAVVVVGNLKGKVGIAIEKGFDVAEAILKAKNSAEKNLIEVPIVDGTVPYEITYKFSATKILLKPAKRGRGLVAGGSIRIVLSLAGYTDVVSKVLGVTKNQSVNALSAIKALESLNKSYQRKTKLQSELMSLNENIKKSVSSNANS